MDKNSMLQKDYRKDSWELETMAKRQDEGSQRNLLKEKKERKDNREESRKSLRAQCPSGRIRASMRKDRVSFQTPRATVPPHPQITYKAVHVDVHRARWGTSQCFPPTKHMYMCTNMHTGYLLSAMPLPGSSVRTKLWNLETW